MSSKKEPNMFVFAVIICLVCSLLLTFASTALKDRQDYNVQLDKQKNVLKAMGLYVDGIDVDVAYRSSVQDKWMNASGRLVDQKVSDTDLPIYVNIESGLIRSYLIAKINAGL